VKLLQSVGDLKENPYGNLNLGIVKVRIDPARPFAQLRFQIYGHEGDSPRFVYESAVIDRP
jgi:hypothetical protein